mmetsp:Transcript_105286/g.250630  ORF Transcript_105286/g.250630 Transcript_105286/m.250630 type:complete len:279 (-) Transcript_105286:443-1279(-)
MIHVSADFGAEASGRRFAGKAACRGAGRPREVLHQSFCLAHLAPWHTRLLGPLDGFLQGIHILALHGLLQRLRRPDLRQGRLRLLQPHAFHATLDRLFECLCKLLFTAQRHGAAELGLRLDLRQEPLAFRDVLVCDGPAGCLRQHGLQLLLVFASDGPRKLHVHLQQGDELLCLADGLLMKTSALRVLRHRAHRVVITLRQFDGLQQRPGLLEIDGGPEPLFDLILGRLLLGRLPLLGPFALNLQNPLRFLYRVRCHMSSGSVFDSSIQLSDLAGVHG